MNPAHLHLAINHAPVITFAIALVFLLLALIRKNQTLTQAALSLTVASALLCLAAYLTGSGASTVLRDFDHNHSAMSAHAKFGKLTMIVALCTGALALATLFATDKGQSRKWLVGMVAGTVVAVNMMLTATATLGGDINHSEIATDQFSEMIGRLFGLNSVGHEETGHPDGDSD